MNRGRGTPVKDRFYELAEDILSYDASTREGLALQAKAFISSYSEVWEHDEGRAGFCRKRLCLRWRAFPSYP
jgi:hypothetical protein